MTDEEARRIQYRQRYLPIQLEATRRKLLLLEAEAWRIGLSHLVDDTADPTPRCAP